MVESLDKILCGFDKEKHIPKHAGIIPLNEQYNKFPKLYCCDARKEDCYYSLIHKNKSYCMFRKNYNSN